MFIVKDLRKIPEILTDPNDERTELKLARRGPELKGNLDILVNTATDESILKVTYLSLYNDGLNTLNGISIFSQSNLITVNLGKNFLREIPAEFSSLQTVEELHLEDNKFTEFPTVLLELVNIKILRLSGNAINTVPNLSSLSKLQKLYIDNCHLSSIDNVLDNNYELNELQIRGNNISQIPDEIYNLTKLETLYMNSNKITEISSNIEQLMQLRILIANSNRISVIPTTILNLKNITKINLCNNDIDELPARLVEEWIATKPTYLIQLEGNPLVVNPRALSESEFTQPVTKEWKKQKTK